MTAIFVIQLQLSAKLVFESACLGLDQVSLNFDGYQDLQEFMAEFEMTYQGVEGALLLCREICLSLLSFPLALAEFWLEYELRNLSGNNGAAVTITVCLLLSPVRGVFLVNCFGCLFMSGSTWDAKL